MPSTTTITSVRKQRSHADYTVACICPMGIEMAAVEGMLEEIHDTLPPSHGQNAYTFGRLAGHNVVVAAMPQIGNNAAASVATQLLNDFGSIRFGLLVGIGGGIPGKKGEHDIRLGDVVVSQASGTFGGVVQYDMGKVTAKGRFERGGVLCKPPSVLSANVERLKSKHHRLGNRLTKSLNEMLAKYPRMVAEYSYPGDKHDRLFKSSYRHTGGSSCQNCDLSRLVLRTIRSSPDVHYGTIASGNTVIKDSSTRDRLQRDLSAICVDMEAAGVMDTTLPCLVIRGICDYADSHKSSRWQPYAAAIAAAYAKELLTMIPVGDVQKARPVPISDPIEPSGNSMSISDLALQLPLFLSDFAKVMKCIEDVQKDFVMPPTIMASVAAQCQGIQAAIIRLQRLDIERIVAFKSQHDRIMHVMEGVIVGCKGTLALIEEYILDFRTTTEREASNQMEVDAKLESVWNGNDIQELLSQLNGYQAGLTNLLVISESNSIHEIRSLLVNQKLALDDLVERSRKSWNKKPASTLTRSGSLRFSIIASSDAFSTTAIHTDLERDETIEPPFALDHIICSSRAYRRYMFRNPKFGSSAQIQDDMLLTSNDLSMHPSQQESITAHSENTACSPFSRSNESNDNIAPFKQLNIFNGQNEATEAQSTVPAVIQTSRRTTPNFSRRELVSRKSVLVLHPSEGAPSPQAVQAPEMSEPSLVTRPSAAHVDAEIHGDTTLNTAPAMPPPLKQFYKIILLGAGAVGKSPLAMQFASPLFELFCAGEEFDPTIEDYHRAECSVDGKPVVLEIVDHSGQMEYSGLWEDHIRACDCIMLVYSIASRRSYQEVLYFIEEVSRLTAGERLPIVLVGNKCDLRDLREVSRLEGQELADNIMCPFFETSVKSNVNVNEAFHEAVREIRRSRDGYIDWMISSFARVTTQLRQHESIFG